MSWLSVVAKWFRNSDELTIKDGWLVGRGVTRIPSHQSWYGGDLAPRGIVCHVSATNPGTAVNMAKRRARKFGLDEDDRLSSWHASIEADGAIVQMVPLNRKAHHAGSDTSKPIPNLGWANSHTLGLELIGWERGPFPQAQVDSYARVLRAIVRHYGIERRFAMITHASVDPKRRSDPGHIWMSEHAERVLDAAYES